MTVADIRHGMSAEEYMAWSVYYAKAAQQKQLARLRGR